MTDTSTEAIAALMDGVTPGPWDWQVSRSTMTVELSGGKQTKAGGDLTVMSFARYGMRRAAPVFWTWDGLTATRVERADKLAIAVPGREHHAEWFARIDHPDARFIAAARELVPALAADRDALRAEVERLRAFITEFAAADFAAEPLPPKRHPEDEVDPVTDAEHVWAWQRDAREVLKGGENG